MFKAAAQRNAVGVYPTDIKICCNEKKFTVGTFMQHGERLVLQNNGFLKSVTEAVVGL